MSTNDPTEPRTGTPVDGEAGPQRYEIRVRGHLGTRWTAWFDGLCLTDEADGTTTISGPVVDQAALHGLLARLRDLGIPLLSLTRLAPGDASAPVERHPHPIHRTEPGAHR